VTADATPISPGEPVAATEPGDLPAEPRWSVPRRGWGVIAEKEFSDHLTSLRFVVLTVVLGLAALVPLYFVADRIRGLASQASGAQAVFLALFTIAAAQPPDPLANLQVDRFVGIVAPLVGMAFAFDAVNGERAEGTLPRLLSQPIHRDDVINGKFLGGLAVIALVLAVVVAVIAAFGLVRLGIVPASSEILRIVVWLGVTFLYVALWLAFGLLLSVVLRRAATSALIGFGVWILVTFFGPLIVGLVAGVVAPLSTATSGDQVLAAAATQETINRLLPSTLYEEVSLVVLNPAVTGVSTPATIGQYVSAQEQIPTLLSLDQSLLLVWPHVVALVALTVVCFAVAYVLFMRQEVRA
jgi:ABC-2 type transport system permease protein